MPLLPVNLNLKDIHCLVVGGGKIAHRKTVSLLECDARVTVIAPTLHTDFTSQLTQIEYISRNFKQQDCKNARLVFACTNDSAINSLVASIARQEGVWCNVCDDSSESTFQSAACVRRRDVTIAIGTSGQSPALAKHLKKLVQDCIAPEYGTLATLLLAYRHGEATPQEFSQFFESSTLQKVLLSIRNDDITTAKELLRTHFSR